MREATLLLGNDLPSCKVKIDSYLSSDFCVSDSTNEISQEIPGLFPACTITCTMLKMADKQFSLLANHQSKSHKVDLSDTFPARDHVYDNCIQMTTQFPVFCSYQLVSGTSEVRSRTEFAATRRVM